MSFFDFLQKNNTVVENTYSKSINTQNNETLNKNNPSDEQLCVFNILESSNDNYFVTGKAGTGKSFLLKYFAAHSKKRCAVVAPTGVAAINCAGVTIHSLFGLDQHAQNPRNEEQLKISDNQMELLNSIDTLIIDEVSMVRSDIMDIIDAKLKKARHSECPFGGCQIIAFGDLYQLPPFCGDSEIKKYIYDTHHSEFFFAAPVFNNNPINIIELNDNHRQQGDKEFIKILNRIRVGENSSDILEQINQRCIPPAKNSRCVSLVPSNEAANLINNEKLANLPGKLHIFRGEIQGQFSEKEAPTDINLSLKVGAKIMMLKNDPEGRWHNGSFGIIEDIKEPDLIIAKIYSSEDEEKGYIYEINRESWQKFEYKYDSENKTIYQEQIGSFTQFPIRLSYAITIHKSQGKTFDSVNIDYSKGHSFAPGQTYVALSRCRNLNGLYLSKPLLSSDIKVNLEVVRFMNCASKIHAYDNTAHSLVAVNKSPITSAEEVYVPQEESPKEIEWLQTQQIKVPIIENPKKVTGTRFPAIVGKDKFKSPFAVWCEIMRVYTPPFDPNNIYVIAGKIIEPKQYRYLMEKIKNDYSIISPEDRFGPDAAENMKFNFFDEENEIFGGMWDYLLEKDNKRCAVFEMKTTKYKNRQFWISDIPENVRLQAALYAYLLQVDEFFIVASFIEPQYYDEPQLFICSDKNTIIKKFSLSRDFKDFEHSYIKKVSDWWEEHVKTGISPQYDNSVDHEILNELRAGN